MKRSKMLQAAAMICLAALPAGGQTKGDPGWGEMKSLVGAWRGTAEGKPVSVTHVLVSNGTALMETLDGDHDASMVTMYTADGDTILATHY